MAESTKRNKTFLFDRKTGDLRRTFFGMDKVEYSVHYAGGDDFVVIRNETVKESEPYMWSIRINNSTTYLRQTVSLLNVVTEEKRDLSLDRCILSVSDRYSVGMTEETRRRYPLTEGYFSLCYYVTDGKTTDGTYRYCLTDRSLNILKDFPDGISPVLFLENGYTACAGVSGAIYLFDEKGDVSLRIDDATYQSVSYSCGIIGASKLTDGKRMMGCFDAAGNVVIPFEYDVISCECTGGLREAP